MCGTGSPSCVCSCAQEGLASSLCFYVNRFHRVSVETHGGPVRYLGAAPSDPNCVSVLFLGQGAAAEVSSSFVILSVCALVVLVVLLANCVSCCKDPEIDFKVRLQVRNVHACDIGSCVLAFLPHCTCFLLNVQQLSVCTLGMVL